MDANFGAGHLICIYKLRRNWLQKQHWTNSIAREKFELLKSRINILAGVWHRPGTYSHYQRSKNLHNFSLANIFRTFKTYILYYGVSEAIIKSILNVATILNQNVLIFYAMFLSYHSIMACKNIIIYCIHGFTQSVKLCR